MFKVFDAVSKFATAVESFVDAAETTSLTTFLERLASLLQSGSPDVTEICRTVSHIGDFIRHNSEDLDAVSAEMDDMPILFECLSFLGESLNNSDHSLLYEAVQALLQVIPIILPNYFMYEPKDGEVSVLVRLLQNQEFESGIMELIQVLSVSNDTFCNLCIFEDCGEYLINVLKGTTDATQICRVIRTFRQLCQHSKLGRSLSYFRETGILTQLVDGIAPCLLQVFAHDSSIMEDIYHLFSDYSNEAPSSEFIQDLKKISFETSYSPLLLTHYITAETSEMVIPQVLEAGFLSDLISRCRPDESTMVIVAATLVQRKCTPDVEDMLFTKVDGADAIIRSLEVISECPITPAIHQTKGKLMIFKIIKEMRDKFIFRKIVQRREEVISQESLLEQFQNLKTEKLQWEEERKSLLEEVASLHGKLTHMVVAYDNVVALKCEEVKELLDQKMIAILGENRPPESS